MNKYMAIPLSLTEEIILELARKVEKLETIAQQPTDALCKILVEKLFTIKNKRSDKQDG